MKSLFEQIDALEPIIPEEEINRMKAIRSHIWTKDHPEAWRQIVKKRNDKRSTKRKEAKDGD